MPLALETATITARLAAINRAGFLTINSQPRANGVPSDDPTFGWGGPGGYVYQKGYVECFLSPSLLAKVMQLAEDYPSVTYTAVDVHGNTYTNCSHQGVNAVTWGVFPSKEVLQPTIVDYESFLAWKVGPVCPGLALVSTLRNAVSPVALRTRRLRCGETGGRLCMRRAPRVTRCCTICTTHTSCVTWWRTILCAAMCLRCSMRFVAWTPIHDTEAKVRNIFFHEWLLAYVTCARAPHREPLAWHTIYSSSALAPLLATPFAILHGSRWPGSCVATEQLRELQSRGRWLWVVVLCQVVPDRPR